MDDGRRPAGARTNTLIDHISRWQSCLLRQRYEFGVVGIRELHCSRSPI